MRKLISLWVILVLFSGCNSENAPDCIQTKGETIREEIFTETFDSITVYGGVKLLLTYGEEQKIEVETGENLINDVHFTVEGKQLSIKNKNECNLVRSYENTKVFVTLPDLTYLRNASQFTIESTNELKFNKLQLISTDNDKAYKYVNGDFDLQLNSEEITIVSNGYSHYFLKGKVENLDTNFYNGDSRLEAENLIAQHVKVYHRGSNKIIVNPQESLVGELVSTGDLISVNKPPVVDVKELYTGELIFK